MQAAAKAAANINAQLAAEGKLQLQQQQQQHQSQHTFPNQAGSCVDKRKEKPKYPNNLFNAEVEINDLPPRVRNLLTKGYIQEQIQWKSSEFAFNVNYILIWN